MPVDGLPGGNPVSMASMVADWAWAGGRRMPMPVPMPMKRWTARVLRGRNAGLKVFWVKGAEIPP
jgi:hypothetical protein